VTVNFCDVCGTEWDPRSADHKRGIDCASGLAAAIAGVQAQLKMTLKHVQELEAEYKTEKEEILDTFRRVTDRHSELLARVEALLRRVHVMEHPELKKVPSIRAALDDKEAKAGSK
jgi:hypothetical protein